MGWALEEIGHQVYYLNQISADGLEQAIKTFKPDIFFDMGWDVEHSKVTRVEMLGSILKQHNLYHAYFAEEDSLHFERWSKPYTAQTSPQFVLTRSQSCVAEYIGMGFQSMYLDVGCNPRFHRTVPLNLKYACDVSVVANAQLGWDIYRRQSIADLVLPLLDMPGQIRIWGRSWDKLKTYLGRESPSTAIWKGIISFVETPAIYSSSTINISVQSVADQVSSRTYDILAAGGFLLTSDTPGVTERLQPGVHCDVSKSSEETLEKVRFYLTHESLCNKIALAGQEYAQKWFSYQHSLPAVWAQVEEHLNRLKGLNVS